MTEEDVQKVLQQIEALTDERLTIHQQITEYEIRLEEIAQEIQKVKQLLPIEVRMDLLLQGK